MAASGRSHVEGSVEDFDISCKPCEDNGDFVEASGYCKNCDEYLCKACMKVHCQHKTSKHHVVLNKQQMPRLKTRKSDVVCTITCDKHPAVFLKFVCKIHDVTGCGECMDQDHKTCVIEYISTLANGHKTSIEYTSMIQKVDQLRAEVNYKLADGELSATDTDETVKKAISDIKEYRNDVNSYSDEVERSLLDACHKIKQKHQDKVQQTNDELKSPCDRLSSFQERLTSNTNNSANLYVLTRESSKLLDALVSELKAVKKTQAQSVKFVKNAALTSEISSATALGELQVNTKLSEDTSVQRKRVMDMVPNHQIDISTEIIPRCIRGIVKVHRNVIACTDFNNKMVILVDINKGKLLSTVALMDKPWDITSICNGKFAVTMPGSSKIQFLEVDNDIVSLKNVIGVKGECRGIDCLDALLAVSYDKPPKIEVMDFQGSVQTHIQTNNAGVRLFKSLWYVAFSRDGRGIYVSDRKDYSVTKLTLDGTVQAIYNDPGLEKVGGVFVCLDGSVLVCSARSIHVMSGDCMKQKLLITQKEGVHFPSGIYFDEDNGIICIRKRGQVSAGKWLSGTAWSSDSIQTYAIK